MKRLLLISAAFAALIAPTIAAEKPVRVYKRARPVVVAAPVYTWTGFYVGGNVGYGWGQSSNAWNVFAPSLSAGVGNFICGPAGAAFCPGAGGSNTLSGGIGGLQAGYNWQAGNFLVGIDTDIELSGQRGSQFSSTGFVAASLGGTASAAYSERLSWLGMLRGRVGVTADRLLFYATGGLAYGHFTESGVATATGHDAFLNNVEFPCPASGICPLANWNNGHTKAGWTAGGGIEWSAGGNWSMKIEYLYIDWDTFNTTFSTFTGCFGNAVQCNVTAPGVGTISSRITDNIVRVGLNYKFGNYYAPVVTQ
jgi:outer membrane immunogenic protein